MQPLRLTNNPLALSQGTIVYRTHTSGRTKRSADLDADGRSWQQHTPGSEVELGKAPLKHN